MKNNIDYSYYLKNIFIIYSIIGIITILIINLNYYTSFFEIPELIMVFALITTFIWVMSFLIYIFFCISLGKESSIWIEIGGISFVAIVVNSITGVFLDIFFNDIDYFTFGSIIFLSFYACILYAACTSRFNYNFINYINYRKASKYHIKENYDRAFEIYKKLVNKKCNYSSLYYNLGIIYHYQKEDFEKAIELYDKAIFIDPDYIKAYVQKYYALFEVGRFEDALIFADKVLEMDNTNYGFWFNKAFLLYKLKKYEKALKCYDEALKLKPMDIDILQYKTLVFEDLKEYDKAFECYDKALKIDPNNSDVLNSKGFLLSELDRLDEGLEYINKSLEIDPENPNTIHSKAYTLEKLGKSAEALKYYDKALKIDPDDEVFINDYENLFKKINNKNDV